MFCENDLLRFLLCFKFAVNKYEEWNTYRDIVIKTYMWGCVIWQEGEEVLLRLVLENHH